MDATGHDDNKAALAPAGDSTVAAPTEHGAAELEKHLGDLAASPQFVPLMGSFRDLLEAERRRNRQRTLLIGAGMIVMLTAFIWGPLHIMRTYIRQSEERLTSEHESLQRVEHSLNDSMTVLADASRELRKTLESYRQSPTSGMQAATEASAQAALTAPAPVSPVAPLVIVSPLPPRPATTSAPPAAVVTMTPPAAATAKVVAVVPVTPPPAVAATKPAAVVAPPPAESNAPAVKPVFAIGVPPDAFRAVTSTPAVPLMVEVTPTAPAVTNRPASIATAETRLDDALADVERTIQALKKRNTTNNAATMRTP